jgi:Bacterial regulatory helix-turn-helix protein, lysR family
MKSLRLLVAVCDLGNIKQAAAQEHIEPSAISKRVARLEHVLGTRCWCAAGVVSCRPPPVRRCSCMPSF